MVDAIVTLAIMLLRIDANPVRRVQPMIHKLDLVKVFARKNRFLEEKDVSARKGFITLVENVINVHLILSIIPFSVDVSALKDYSTIKNSIDVCQFAPSLRNLSGKSASVNHHI